MIEALGILLIGLCFVSLIYFAKESDMGIIDFFKRSKVDQQEGVEAGRGDYLTQAELQQLTKVISEVIGKEELRCSHNLHEAKFFKNHHSQISSDCYEAYNKGRKRINKLAKLQYKLKHKLKTKG